MVPAFYYAEFSRQFRLWKRERSSSYVTDDKDENGRKGRVRKKRNYFKQLLKQLLTLAGANIFYRSLFSMEI